MNNSKNTEPPVKEGDVVRVNITSVGGKGDGVAKVNGFVVFVANASKGESCTIKITKVLPSVSFAEKVAADTPTTVQSGQSSKQKDEFADLNLDDLGEGSEDFGEELE